MNFLLLITAFGQGMPRIVLLTPILNNNRKYRFIYIISIQIILPIGYNRPTKTDLQTQVLKSTTKSLFSSPTLSLKTQAAPAPQGHTVLLMLLLYTMSHVAKCDGYQTLELASNWLQTESKSFVVHKEIKLTQSRRKAQGQTSS